MKKSLVKKTMIETKVKTRISNNVVGGIDIWEIDVPELVCSFVFRNGFSNKLKNMKLMATAPIRVAKKKNDWRYSLFNIVIDNLNVPIYTPFLIIFKH